MGKLIFITGGARSGKSRLAVELAKQPGGNVVFIATCIPKDEEMRARVEKHRESRPKHWKTVERESDVTSLLKNMGVECEIIIIDCLTLLVSNLLLAGMSDPQITKEARRIVEAASELPSTTIAVSNEVGSGIVPENKLARRFRDVAGTVNQIIAQVADEVYLMVSGTPVKIKGAKK